MIIFFNKQKTKIYILETIIRTLSSIEKTFYKLRSLKTIFKAHITSLSLTNFCCETAVKAWRKIDEKNITIFYPSLSHFYHTYNRHALTEKFGKKTFFSILMNNIKAINLSVILLISNVFPVHNIYFCRTIEFPKVFYSLSIYPTWCAIKQFSLDFCLWSPSQQ